MGGDGADRKREEGGEDKDEWGGGGGDKREYNGVGVTDRTLK